jgi:hypothetical protein
MKRKFLTCVVAVLLVATMAFTVSATAEKPYDYYTTYIDNAQYVLLKNSNRHIIFIHSIENHHELWYNNFVKVFCPWQRSTVCRFLKPSIPSHAP